MKKPTFLLTLILLSSGLLYAQQKIMIFGGKNHDVYLGCLTCSEFESDSLTNKFGTYGNKFSGESIFNKFGNYGGKFSDYSPCNKFASHPPIIVDENGNSYGYLTLNKFNSPTTDANILNWLKYTVCQESE